MPDDDTPQKIEVTTGAPDDYTYQPPSNSDPYSKDFATKSNPDDNESSSIVPVTPKKSHKKLTVILLLFVILIAVACTWYFLIRDKPATKTAAPAQVAEQKKTRKNGNTT